MEQPALVASLTPKKRVLEVLLDVGPKGPVIVAVQSGMGNGKSYIIDIASQLLFIDRDPIVLKVSYNFSQDLGLEGMPENAGEGPARADCSSNAQEGTSWFSTDCKPLFESQVEVSCCNAER